MGIPNNSLVVINMVVEREELIELQGEVKTVDFTDLSRIVEQINSDEKPAVIYFKGRRGMDEVFESLGGRIERSNGHRQIFLLHSQQFGSPGVFDKDLTKLGYSELPIVIPQNGDCVFLIKGVGNFDEEALESTLEGIDRYGQHAKLVIFTPNWPTMKPFEALEEWAKKTGAIRFEIDPGCVPGIDFEELRREADRISKKIRLAGGSTVGAYLRDF